MSDILRPRKIEPGCLRRWARNGTDLWRRNPWLLLLNALAIFGITAFMPRLLGIPLLMEIPLSALFFIELRAMDHYGRCDWKTVWSLFMGNLKDIVYLTSDVFVFLFFIVLLMVLSSAVLPTHTMHLKTLLTPLQQLAQHILPWLGNALFSGVGWVSLLSSPVSGPLLFLTLLLGHQLLQHLSLAFQGAFLNRKITIALLVGNIFIGPLTGSLSLLMLPMLGASLTGVLLEILTIGLMLILITVDYLWSREMFEGTTENAPVTRKEAIQTVLPKEATAMGLGTLQKGRGVPCLTA